MSIAGLDADGEWADDEPPESEFEREVQVIRQVVKAMDLRSAAETLRLSWRRQPPPLPPSDPGYPGFYPLD